MNAKTKTRAAILVQKIIRLANEGHPVTFKQDFGGPNLTVVVGDQHHHTHPLLTSDEEFIDYWYQNLRWR